MRGLFSFPHPVNEYAARLVAGMVIVLILTILFTNQSVLLWVLLYGFTARVLTGPTLSPMGLIATKIIVPVLGNPNKPVAGPPKRFAQLIGFLLSLLAIIAEFVFSSTNIAYLLISVIGIFAALESILGFCAGCYVFAILMKYGLIPESTCEKCNNINI
ncbi:MAG: DUF4395 domain-containing protein [SAR202 cluster bacterium]|jgi:hypothetical protein|nr:DUF4395 domain-containing protein [Dehalococcoidia bacterium]MQG24858.1 DUF4395 domain-containing protein [SAR202 cluster bacterium]MQG85074.1 DUF4395 domain-containing protein [SAR202 cluster bacterium]|tara:strand:+ start:6093 stop:6569 length:477 start_codon:yes stop_codon:yes gene_type:complete